MINGAQLLLLMLQAFLLGMICIGIGGWAYSLRQWRQGKPLITRDEPLRPVPWGLADLLALAMILLLLQMGAMRLIGPRIGLVGDAKLTDLPAAAQATMFWSLSLTTLVWVLIAIAVQMLRGTTLQQMGCNLQHLRRDLRIGLVTFGMLAPIVYGIQYVLVRYWPSEHPFIKVLTEEPEPRLLAVGAFAVCVAAPVFEEFAFRVFFQGWLQNVAILLWERRVQDPPADVSEAEPTDPWAVLDQPRQASTNIGQRDIWERLFLGTRHEIGTPGVQFVLWPILTSALTFALLHYSHGPDWVPLTILALGLGYVYQRTGSVLPSIVVHMLLNACSYAILILQILQQRA